MKYYILYPEQTKDSIDYNKQLVADSGMSTVYLQPAFDKVMNVLENLGQEKFEEIVCGLDEITIFSETGEEWNMVEFMGHIASKYKFVKNDF